MRFDLITIFPEFFRGPLDYGIVRRARESGLIEIGIHDLRNFTHDRHRTVDDRPFGGGEGMVLKPEPIFDAVESLTGDTGMGADTSIVLLSASGKLFRQEMARRLSRQLRIILLCGRYEGVDERVVEHLATDEVSIGDFVLSGGELPAALVLDAVTRLLPGALGNEDSTMNESFAAVFGDQLAGDQFSATSIQSRLRTAEQVAENVSAAKSRVANHESRITDRGILDYPHYTRPQSFRGWEVPEVLIGGNHEQIRRWRHQQALAKTMRNRPDLLYHSEHSQ